MADAGSIAEDAPAPRRAGVALAVVFLVLFLDVLGLTILHPVLAYVVRRYTTDALAVALMTVAYAAAQFLAAPLLGALSDRHGRRPVLLFSLLGSALGYLLFGVGGALWVLVLSRLIDGITGGNVSTAIAYVADLTPPPQRARNFGLVGLAFGLGYVVGPALGGALSRLSLDAPAFAAGGLSLLAAAVGFVALDESLPPDRRATGPLARADVNPVGLIAGLLRRPALRDVLGGYGAFLFAFAGVNSVLPVFLIAEFRASPTELAGLFVVAGLTTAVAQSGVIGALVAHYGERGPILGGLVAQAACYPAYLALAAMAPFWPLYLVSALSGASSAVIFATSGALVANEASAREQGKVAGVNASLTSLMNACGPLWAGSAYDRLAPAVPFWSATLAVALAFALLARLRRRMG